MYKSVLRIKRLPKGLTEHEIAQAWALLNQSLNVVGECAIWHWHGHNVCGGKFWIMPVKRAQKKFRYRAFARATKL
ncbi:MAG: hypothetical protein IKN27_07390 [Selenomonadaceae bacterium]|nr:hypothetical protein [Selenomonadaceae bacterium]